MLSAIVCTDLHNGIGKNGKLLFHISKDMKNFARLTEGGVLIYGSHTLDTFPDQKPLPGRENIIVSKSLTEVPGAVVVPSLEEAIAYANKIDLSGQHIFVIGGGTIYAQLLPQIDRVYLTKVYRTVEADTFFPELSDSEWGISQRSENYYDEETGLGFCFMTYERRRDYLNGPKSKKEESTPSNSLERSCRQWLQNKWIMAETIKWVPGINEFREFFRKELKRYLQNIERSEFYREMLQKYFAGDRFPLSDKYPFEHSNECYSSIFNIMMLDVDFGHTGVVVRSPYHDDPLLVVQFMTRTMPLLEEDGSITGVYDLSGYFDGFEDKVLVEKIMEVSGQKSFAERYLEADEYFRRAYPVCPRCGASMEALRFDSGYDYECHGCNWTSSLGCDSKSDLESEFAAKAPKLFHRVKRERNMERKTEQEIGVISGSIDRLAKLYTNTHYEHQFLQAKERILGLVEEKMQPPSSKKK